MLCVKFTNSSQKYFPEYSRKKISLPVNVVEEFEAFSKNKDSFVWENVEFLEVVWLSKKCPLKISIIDLSLNKGQTINLGEKVTFVKDHISALTNFICELLTEKCKTGKQIDLIDEIGKLHRTDLLKVLIALRKRRKSKSSRI